MLEDRDIKIASDKPSADIKRRKMEMEAAHNQKSTTMGKDLGCVVAEKFIDAIKNQTLGGETDNAELLLQRQILLSFAAISGFEQFCKDSDYLSAAKRSFLEHLKNNYPELYSGATDNGALSFYYLAFRRGGEVERRIGQTFAMLCSHDGDPVYHELGEALYCWFTSVIKKTEKSISNI